MRVENIKVSCKLIEDANRRIIDSLKRHKKLPCDLFIAVNASARIIDAENHRIRRAIWRKYDTSKI